MPQRDEYGHTRCKSIKKTLHSHIIYYKKTEERIRTADYVWYYDGKQKMILSYSAQKKKQGQNNGPTLLL